MTSVLNRLMLALKRGGFLRNVALIAGGTALGQGVAILASPLLTRLYAPEDFGILAVFSSLLGLVSVIAGLRYEQAIPLPDRDQDAIGVFLLAIFLVVLSSTALSLGALLFPDDIVRLFDAAHLRAFLWLLPIGLFTTGVYQTLSFWAVRKREYPRLARTRLSQGVSATGTQVLGGLLGSGPVGLIVGQIVGQTAGTITLAHQIWPQVRRVTRPILVAYEGAVRYRHFMVLGTPAALMNSAALQLPGLLLASLFGVESAGFYLLGRRVLGAPLDLIGRSVGQVYFGEAAELARKSVLSMRQLFLKTTWRLVLLALAPVLSLALLSPTLFRLVFGGSWHLAGVFTQLLTVMFFAQFIVTPVSQTFVILERQQYSLILNGLKTLIAFAAFWIPYMLRRSATEAVLCYSLGMAGYYALVFILSLHLMNTLCKSERLADPQ